MGECARFRADPQEFPQANPQNLAGMLGTVHPAHGRCRGRGSVGELLRGTARGSVRILQTARVRQENPDENHPEQGLPDLSGP